MALRSTFEELIEQRRGITDLAQRAGFCWPDLSIAWPSSEEGQAYLCEQLQRSNDRISQALHDYMAEFGML
jgi:hypothetical protein